MTKTIEQIQKENRKFILETIHGCSYDEALKKEEGSTCDYLYQTDYGVIRIMGDIKNYGYNKERYHPNAFLIEIIGRPITLNRVLLAIIKSSKCMDSKENLQKIRNFVLENWDLELETLEQQIEEKQRGVNKILTTI